MVSRPSMIPRRKRSRRRHYALVGVGVCVISYSYTTWLDDARIPRGHEWRRELSYFDGRSMTSDNSRLRHSQFHSLVKPSAVDDAIHSRLPAHDALDGREGRCDDVLLYIPHQMAHRGHARQLNNYLIAALIATYANKAMVVLDGSPKSWKKSYEGYSQFGCPPETWLRDENGKKLHTIDPDFPKGLSRLVQHPTWLSGNCPVPCSKHYDFQDWEDLRVTGKKNPDYPKLYAPQEVMCANDSGRQAKVLVVGGGEVEDYFREHFWERMVQRPVHPGWAIRLGGNLREAEVFGRLKDERQIWDYVSALIAHSGLLKFQPWIARDVEQYVANSGLPLDDPYDAIHVRRGDSLRDKGTKAHVDEFWASAPEVAERREYVPFAHYLSQLQSEGCDDESDPDPNDPDAPTGVSPAAGVSRPRLVYVATDDPDEVRREIDELPKDQDGNVVHPDWCRKFRFLFGPAHFVMPTGPLRHSGFHLHAGPAGNDCGTRYARNIAAVADLMIAAKSDVFVGEFNSNWGRLVRVFRMQLNDTVAIEDGGSPVIEGKTRVAWGHKEPLPPGL